MCFDHYSDHLQGAAASSQLTFTILETFKFSDFEQGTYELPEDDLNNDRSTLERF